MDRNRFLARARGRGVNPLVYWISRALFEPFFLLFFRMSRIGREHIPREGGVIIAANHRSFLDPFVIGTLLRRPVYFVAKRELFTHRLQAWWLSSLGAFPVDRGNGDRDAMETARRIIERGDCVVIFPEGTRTRPGSLGSPKRGVGRLALETGAPVVPVAVLGTESVRRGWRIRPHKVRLRCGQPMTFPVVEEPSPQLARAVMERVWPNVELQWEWLGGTAPLRRAAIVGAGAWGTGLAVALTRAGVEVELGCRTAEQASTVSRTRVNEHYLPDVVLPDAVSVTTADKLALSRADIVCFAVPATALPDAVAAHSGAIPERAGVLVLSKGLVEPLGTLPSAYVSERVSARAVACIGGPGHAADALDNGASLVVGSIDAIFAT
ncbi:MAG: glycerol-3-phosphate dehydrogenase, partial [Solirubrobacteraceae bacterium]|nr:glycerol-3-phosphate dehydrogenase [Solirubrobacteraceae bacterium]